MSYRAVDISNALARIEKAREKAAGRQFSGLERKTRALSMMDRLPAKAERGEPLAPYEYKFLQLMVTCMVTVAEADDGEALA